MPLQIGQALLGKYGIVEFIGQGAFGRVYLAEEQPPGRRRVAIKELRHDLPEAQQQEARERFEREIEIGSQLDHPHIVRMITFERRDGDIYLVLEYMEGGSLRQRLDRKGPLPIDEAVRIAIEICQALEYLHKQQLDLVHRDVTPRNILFQGDGTAKLTDFGVVQSPGYTWTRWSGGKREHPGDPFYRAPEALDPEPLRASADVYMLGCVLWEMLTGRTYKTQDPGTPPSSLRSDVPHELDALVLKAVAEDRGGRYRAAANFGADLAAFQAVQNAAKRARLEAEQKARREAEEEERRQRLAGWYAEAQRRLAQDPEQALALLAQIRAEEPGYPGLAKLQTQSQAALARQKKREEETRQKQTRERWKQEARRALDEKDWARALSVAATLEQLGGPGKQWAREIRGEVQRGRLAEQQQGRSNERSAEKDRWFWLAIVALACLVLLFVAVAVTSIWWRPLLFPAPTPTVVIRENLPPLATPAVRGSPPIPLPSTSPADTPAATAGPTSPVSAAVPTATATAEVSISPAATPNSLAGIVDVSPQGLQMIQGYDLWFSDYAGDQWRIWHLDSQSGTVGPVSFQLPEEIASQDQFVPAVSPDGENVAFAVGPCVESGHCNRDLYLAKVDGTNVQRLTDACLDEFHPSWSPDGRLLAYFAGSWNDPECPNTTHGIWVLELGTGQSRQLTDQGDFDPVWSPDGRYIAYHSAVPSWDLKVLDFGSCGSAIGRCVSWVAADMGSLAHSAGWLDNSTLVFSSDAGGTFSIYQVDIRPNQLLAASRITENDWDDQYSAVSTDGKILIWQAFPGYSGGDVGAATGKVAVIYVMTLDNHVAVPLVTGTGNARDGFLRYRATQSQQSPGALQLDGSPTLTPTAELLGSTTVPGHSSEGIRFLAQREGRYVFEYAGGAYSPWSGGQSTDSKWRTRICAYRNREISWGQRELNPEDNPSVTYVEPVKSDGCIGNYLPSTETEATNAAKDSPSLSFELGSGDYLILVAMDDQGYYADNLGEVVFNVLLWGSER